MNILIEVNPLLVLSKFENAYEFELFFPVKRNSYFLHLTMLYVVYTTQLCVNHVCRLIWTFIYSTLLGNNEY